MRTGYIGTYSEHNSQGIYQFVVNQETGVLGDVSLFTAIKNSKYLAITDDYIFSVFDDSEESGVAVYDFQGTLVTKETYESSTSCYILVSGNDIYTSHYHLGTISHLVFDPKKKTLSYKGQHLIVEKAGSHQVIANEDLLYVPCLHLDSIKVFTRSLQEKDEIILPTGAGCRHGVISLDGKYLYILGELSNEIYVIHLQRKEIVFTCSLLPEGVQQNHGGAAIRLSGNGKRLYASTREPQNRITVFHVEDSSLKVETSFVVDGEHPRDILNVIDDRYLLVANRGTDTIHSFALEKGYREINRVKIPAGVSIVMR